MKSYNLTYDGTGTHFDWELTGVTTEMIDWFWSNMEKCFLLWHPEEHEPLTWAIPPKHGNIAGAVHIAPQTWSDGIRRNLYIRFEKLEELPEIVTRYIEYEHCIVVAGLGFGPESLEVSVPMGYRVHQWQNTPTGVIGKSNAIGHTKKENQQEGEVWALHAQTEIGNWEIFLPDLHRLYQVVKNTDYNPYMDLSINLSKNKPNYIHAQI